MRFFVVVFAHIARTLHHHFRCFKLSSPFSFLLLYNHAYHVKILTQHVLFSKYTFCYTYNFIYVHASTPLEERAHHFIFTRTTYIYYSTLQFFDSHLTEQTKHARHSRSYTMKTTPKLNPCRAPLFFSTITLLGPGLG